MWRLGGLPNALVVLLLSLALCPLAYASSSIPPPLKRIEHPSTLRLEILPRIARRLAPYEFPIVPHDTPLIQPTDSLRLTLSAFSRTFYLHLHPNFDLLHPNGRINYFTLSDDGTSKLHHSEALYKDAIMAYQGDVVGTRHTLQRLREDAAGGLHQMHGTPQGSEGWARIVIHSQGDDFLRIPPTFEGAFSVDGVVHHIVTLDKYLKNRLSDDPWPDFENLDHNLVIYRDSDIGHPEASSATTCSHDKLLFNQDFEQHPVLRLGAGLDRDLDMLDSLWSNDPMFDFTSEKNLRRGDISNQLGNSSSNFIGDIGSTKGCSASEQILYMGVAADCTYVSFYGSVQNATAHILNNFNIVSSLYKSTFNVSIGIVELNVQDAECPATKDPANPWNVPCADATLDDRLALFSQWRGDKGGGDGAGLWHLMTGCPTGTEIGVAWLGTLCSTTASGSGDSIVSGTGVTSASRTEWGVISHEIGHNFGAIHDCDTNCTLSDNCCPLSTTSCNSNENFLMSPISQSKQSVFSQCTLGNICTAMTTMNTSCLQSATSATISKTITLQMCGNGIVEAGEDCDPGVGGNSTCCDAQTCKFTSGSVCDPLSSDCCTPSCQFAPTTQTCRPERDAACDTGATCSGTSAQCPTAHTKADGTSCGSGLACASGACTSNDLQCQAVGSSLNLTKACNLGGSDSCYNSCVDPSNPSQCMVLQSVRIDGSPCGYGGRCKTGNCVQGNIFNTIKAWITGNKDLSIPILAVGGFIVLLLVWTILLAIIRRCCCGSRRSDERLHGSQQYRERLGSIDRLEQVTAVPPPQASGSTVKPVRSPPRAQMSAVRTGGATGSGGYSSSSSQSTAVPASLRPGPAQVQRYQRSGR
ncbi:hypothetical protein DL93DRAFT_2070654 [Clavulina sp. PMI_390]|nr:hypothetical protein DL93DRAFT_2070654 [Clavulina sp. PMI_390]